MGADQNICKSKNYEKGMCILINTHIYIYIERERDTYSVFCIWSKLVITFAPRTGVVFLQPRTMVQW